METAAQVCIHNALCTLKIAASEKPHDNVLLGLFRESGTLVANEHCL